VKSLFELGPSRVLFAIAMAGLAALTFVYDDFALQWQPVPEWIPWRGVLVYVSACALLGGAVGLLLQRIAAKSAWFLTAYLMLFWVLPQALKLAPSLTSVGSWLSFCETLGAASGACVLAGLLARDATSGAPLAAMRIARRIFGLCCLVYGVSHFVYADFTASMIPAWLPQRLSLAYATGVVHMAAGLGIALLIFPRVAALCEALMMSAFVLLLHIPSLWAAPPPDWGPTARTEMTPLFWALALTAGAWAVARAFKNRDDALAMPPQ
jgi:uncharacterized membrane protein